MPPKCGLGGELVALVLPAGQDTPRSLIALGPAPGELPDYVRRHGLAATGPASVAVPAAPAGYAALAELSRFGLAAAVAPAIALAEAGIVWSALCARLAAQADDLLMRHQPGGCVYRPATAPLAEGDVLRLPAMAELLRQFGRRGAELFASPDGATDAGEALVARVRAGGGVLNTADLQRAQAHWAPAESAEFESTTVYTTTAPSYGPVLLDALRRARAAPQAPLWEAVAGATATLPTDPRGVLVDGTSVVAAVDADGGAAVVVHSNSFPQFGSGLVLADYDLVLSNRPGRGFSADPAAPNAVRSGVRPAATLHAWMIADPIRPALLGATSGGEHQVEWNAQLVSRLLADPDLDPGEAVLDNRWERVPPQVRHEQWEASDDDRAGALVGSSHALVRRATGTGALHAVADPRLGAVAIGV